MPCYTPLSAYYAPGGAITFNHRKSFGIPVQIPCRRCIGCRLHKAKEWALRCTHEASLYDNGLNNTFITLTYRDADLPKNGNLDRSHFQKFIKRLRKNTKKNIRYYMCGEYGEKTNRPHYHALLFGFQFADRKLVNIRRENRVYTSKQLDETWSHGTCEIGSVTFQSAGYVARYILKKQKSTPDEIFGRYVIVDPDTGEMTARQNEYTNMSLKPGIGKGWYDKHKSDLFPHDYAVLPDGRQMPVPSYYRDLLKREDPSLYEKLREARIEKSRADPNTTPERLSVREKCTLSKTKNLKRDL